MPTGYTSDLYEGKDVSFPEFAMRCARAFGALVQMRDMPPDAPIPDQFAPHSYHKEALERAQRQLEEVTSWDAKEAERGAERSHQELLKETLKGKVSSRALKKRYETMLEKVATWEPPTSDHERLKQYMTEQLQQSLDFDCATSLYYELPARLTGEEYREQQIAAAQRDIEYHSEQYTGEVERAEERTEWVKQLRESLEPTSQAVVA
jgi:hypothetical protein